MGFVLFGTARVFGPHAIFIQAVPFALLHVGKPPIELLLSLIGGVVLGLLVWCCRSFWIAVPIHAVQMLALDFWCSLRIRTGANGLGLEALRTALTGIMNVSEIWNMEQGFSTEGLHIPSLSTAVYERFRILPRLLLIDARNSEELIPSNFKAPPLGRPSGEGAGRCEYLPSWYPRIRSRSQRTWPQSLYKIVWCFMRIRGTNDYGSTCICILESLSVPFPWIARPRLPVSGSDPCPWTTRSPLKYPRK